MFQPKCITKGIQIENVLAYAYANKIPITNVKLNKLNYSFISDCPNPQH